MQRLLQAVGLSMVAELTAFEVGRGTASTDQFCSPTFLAGKGGGVSG
jgi:hypothetical protein